MNSEDTILLRLTNWAANLTELGIWHLWRRKISDSVVITIIIITINIIDIEQKTTKIQGNSCFSSFPIRQPMISKLGGDANDIEPSDKDRLIGRCLKILEKVVKKNETGFNLTVG